MKHEESQSHSARLLASAALLNIISSWFMMMNANRQTGYRLQTTIKSAIVTFTHARILRPPVMTVHDSLCRMVVSRES